MTTSAVCAEEYTQRTSRSTGKERDTESGNDYFGAMYYAIHDGLLSSREGAISYRPHPFC